MHQRNGVTGKICYDFHYIGREAGLFRAAWLAWATTLLSQPKKKKKRLEKVVSGKHVFFYFVGLLHASFLPVASLLGDAFFPRAGLLQESFSSLHGQLQKSLQSLTGLLTPRSRLLLWTCCVPPNQIFSFSLVLVIARGNGSTPVVFLICKPHKLLVRFGKWMLASIRCVKILVCSVPSAA